MKKLLTILIVLIPLIINAQKVFYVNAKSGLNFRAKPRGKVLGKFKHKKALEVLGYSDEIDYIKDGENHISGSWARVRNDGKIVYVYDGFLANKKPVDNYGEIKYMTVLCDCFGQFDKDNYSESTLRKIAETYIDEAGGMNFFYDVTPPDIEDIEKLDINKLIQAHKNKIKYLKSIKINSTYWTRRIKEEVEYAKKTFIVDRVMLLAYKNPEKLNDYAVGDEASHYRSVLIAGGKEMLNEWEKLIQEKKRGRYNLDTYENEYREKRGSKRKYDYARSDLMRYRMWNNMKHPKRPNRDNDTEEFLKLFFYDNCSCDD